jgi:V/A-type H+-transporting ATPase subunit I
MAIVKMDRFTLLAFESQRSLLLEKLQAFENVQFTQLSNYSEGDLSFLTQVDTSNEIAEVEGDLSKVKFTLELLNKYVDKPGLLTALKEGKKTLTYKELEKFYSSSKWRDIYTDLKEKENNITQRMNQINKLSNLVEELKPWINLDASISEIENIKSISSFIGVLPQAFVESLKSELEASFKEFYFEIINSTTKESNVILIFHKDDESKGDILLKKYSFSKVNLNINNKPCDSIKNYEDEINNHKVLIESTNKDIKGYTKNYEEFKLVSEYLENKLTQLKAAESFFKSNNIVAIEGFYPSEEHNRFVKIIESAVGKDYYLEFSQAEGEEVPVMLKNNTVFGAFEPITAMYSVPKYNEIDPTPLFTPFYIVFFGMMLSDAAYGLIILICTGFALKKFNLDGEMKKTIRMFFYLSISTIIWGILYGSYFGKAIFPPLWMAPDSDVSTLMIVSILFGLVQIYVGLGIKAYMLIKNGEPVSAILDVGLWYITLTGTIIWAVDALGSASTIGIGPGVVKIAGIATIIGMVLIVLTHGRTEKSVGAKLGSGLYSLYGITSYIGDLVSYTRLAALGLATGFIGAAFNIMVGMLGKSVFTIIFAAIVFTFGHVFNLLINALGAYVHTSRLQYLEYFGKFYEGGGKAFSPLKYNSKYYKIMNLKNEEE